MKLSELLSKPFKLKGGGILNLKGFSKRVIDKEVGDKEHDDTAFSKIINLFSQPVLPHPNKLEIDGSIVDFPTKFDDSKMYHFLYKYSDIINLSSEVFLINRVTLSNYYVSFYRTQRSSVSIIGEYYIDGETYIFLEQEI